ncbi:unnamed protein product [Microthlaspi erraticum]|uniref:Retrotransposon gag domain-containing protein n=1 Tax=Microthlaspi erraticum TaxID=1685480 RepID=A0A6D2JEY9_9BRAS|nr:unnamed protein product [Microthlaspi erraticum]
MSSPMSSLNIPDSSKSEIGSQPTERLPSPPPKLSGIEPTIFRWPETMASNSSLQAMSQLKNQSDEILSSQLPATARTVVNGNYQQFPATNDLVDRAQFHRANDPTDLARLTKANSSSNRALSHPIPANRIPVDPRNLLDCESFERFQDQTNLAFLASELNKFRSRSLEAFSSSKRITSIYVNRFKAIIAKIENPNEAVALLAFRNNLWYKSKFREELIVRPPVSLDDALRCASTFATFEEEINLLLERHRKGRLPQHSLSFANSVLKPNPSSDLEKFCEHHQIYGHSTDECRARAKELAKKQRAEAKWKNNQPSSNDNDKASRKREREVGIISQESPLSQRSDSTRPSVQRAQLTPQLNDPRGHPPARTKR